MFGSFTEPFNCIISGWCQPVRQEFKENECEALPGVDYPGVRDNRSTLTTKTGYDDDDEAYIRQATLTSGSSISSFFSRW